MLILLVSSLAHGAPTPDFAAQCNPGGVYLSLMHHTAAYVVEREAKLASAEMRQPQPTPPGGSVFVLVEASSIDRVDLDQFTIIVFDDLGREILRAAEDDYRSPSHPGSLWMNVGGWPILQAGPYPLRVHVADRVSAKRCTWWVDDRGVVELVPLWSKYRAVAGNEEAVMRTGVTAEPTP